MKKYIILTIIVFGVNQIKSSYISIAVASVCATISGYIACDSLNELSKRSELLKGLDENKSSFSYIKFNGFKYQVGSDRQLYKQDPISKEDKLVDRDQVATLLNPDKQRFSLMASTAVLAGSLWVLKRAFFS